MKRVVSIQDISCIGKCSQTVSVPVVSAMGIETVVLPTAILSAPTDFKNCYIFDLTEELPKIISYWQKEEITFDAIYSGYLLNSVQIDLVMDFIMKFKAHNTKVIVDPAMADNGKLYTGFNNNYVKKMVALCKEADVILPNITEACLLTNISYVGEDASENTIKEMLLKLYEMGCRFPVITGVKLEGNKIGYMAYDPVSYKFLSYGKDLVKIKLHGTGDLFASTFVGAYSKGINIEESLKIAEDFTYICIKNTYDSHDYPYNEVNFENNMEYLLKLLKE